MTRILSLRVRLALVAGAVLVGALLTGLGGPLLWMSDAIKGEQSANVRLLVSEFERLVAGHHARSGELPTADMLKQVIHSRWIREAGLLRISVFLSDGTIIADTETRQVGQIAPAHWRAGAPGSRLHDLTDRAGQNTYVAAISVPGHQPKYWMAFQVQAPLSHPDFLRAIHSLLGLGVPMALISLAALIGLCSLVSRLILADSPLRDSHGGHRASPPSPDAVSTTPADHPPGRICETIEALERTAHDLQELASR